MDSVDNLSDHFPLFIFVIFFVETVAIQSLKIASRSPLWRKASSRDIQQYQCVYAECTPLFQLILNFTITINLKLVLKY